MSFKPSHGVRLAEVFDYLSSTSQVRSSLGGQLEHLKYGTSPVVGSDDGASEQAMVNAANMSHCVSELCKQQNVFWAPVDVLGKFALRARLRPGAVAVSVVSAYQPWHLHVDKDAKIPAGTVGPIEERGIEAGPDRGLAEVSMYMREHMPHLHSEDAVSLAGAFSRGERTEDKARAALLLADADIVVGEWVDLWNKKAGFKSFITVKEFVAKYEVPERTVRDWCASGKLDAVIVGNEYRIDVSQLDDY